MGASASKIKFRESLTSLTTRDVSASDAEFWDELWKIPSSSEEVFELLTPTAARRLRDDRFDNLATLFTQATAQLCQIVETPYTIYFDQALNCVRVLTRVVPFLLEKGDLGENDPNVELLCWGEKTSAVGIDRRGSIASGGGSRRLDRLSGGHGNKENKMGILSGGGRQRKKTNVAARLTNTQRKGIQKDWTRPNNSHSEGDGLENDSLSSPNPTTSEEEDDQDKRSTSDYDDDDTDIRSTSDYDDDEDEDDYDETSDAPEDEKEDDLYDEELSEKDDDDDDEDDNAQTKAKTTASELGNGIVNGVDDDSEPLALLVVHAAMHMLFLPQFTCEFYDEDVVGTLYEEDYDQDSDDDSVTAKEVNENGEDPIRARILDIEGRLEAGLGIRPRKIKGGGVRLAPRPAGIVWAPGVGFTTDGYCHVGVSLDPVAVVAAATADKTKNNKQQQQQGKNQTKSKKKDKDDVEVRIRFNPEAAYTRKYDRNRIEVLRLLLASCSDPLFSPADEYNPLASRWMSVAVAADAPNAPCLFYSLLNIVLSYDPSKSNFAGGHHVELVELSAQVLCVLLDCGLSGDPVPYENRRGEPVVALDEAYKVGFNIFRLLLARIDNGKDLNTLYRGFVRLLRTMYESKNTILPTSQTLLGNQTRLDCHQELLILLWKTLEENPLFLDFILTRCDVCELVVPICYLMYVSRKDATAVGLIHICTFILLKLSGERSFGVTLNRPFRTKLPCDIPLFTGSHADLVTITLHKIMVNGSYRLVPLYSCFLTIISNFSPYWRSMSLLASVKMVNLFELFSSPKFLYSSEKAYRHIALLLEIFNNIVQYQYIGNQHLVYAIVRRKDSFGRLANLTLPKAIAQCQKAFPKSDAPEYDADVDEQVAAMSTRIVTDTGKPLATENTPHHFVENAENEVGIKTKKPMGRFIPTDAWITELRSALPMEAMNRLLQHLVPVIDDMCARKNGVVDEEEILEVFKDITMVGLLPVPHAIVIRKYQPNQYTSIWFTAYLWGVVYLRSQKPPIFDGERIELFQVSNDGERKL